MRMFWNYLTHNTAGVIPSWLIVRAMDAARTRTMQRSAVELAKQNARRAVPAVGGVWAAAPLPVAKPQIIRSMRWSS